MCIVEPGRRRVITSNAYVISPDGPGSGGVVFPDLVVYAKRFVVSTSCSFCDIYSITIDFDIASDERHSAKLFL